MASHVLGPPSNLRDDRLAPRSSFSQLWEAAQQAETAVSPTHAEAENREEEVEEDDDDDDDEADETEEEILLVPAKGSKRKPTAASSGASATVSERPVKRVRRRRSRKPTYLIQKEERELLAEEIRVLEARAELLRMKSGLPTAQDKRSLADLQTENFDIEEKIHVNLMHLGSCQGLLSSHINATPVNPMKAYVHLPRNVRARRDLMRSMKNKRLRRAEELTTQRLHYLDPLKPYLSEERFLDDAGVFHCKRYEILQFDGLESARAVFDALAYFLSNVEISVTETLGHLTIREDSDDFDPTIWNHRVISRNTGGYTEDMNVVGFTHYKDDLVAPDGSAVGVVACDSVDDDDLHPYVSHERVRKDMTASYTVHELRRPDTRQPVVVLKRCVFMSIHPPQFELAPATIESMREQMMSWAPIMARLIRDKVYADRHTTVTASHV